MYFGCASVLQSIVTSVPDGAPTNWFGTNIIGETVFIHRDRLLLLLLVSVCCVYGCRHKCRDSDFRASKHFSYAISYFDWVASYMCLHACFSISKHPLQRGKYVRAQTSLLQHFFYIRVYLCFRRRRSWF